MSYNGKEKALIWLAVQDIALAKKHKLLALCEPYELWRRLPEYGAKLTELLSEESYESLLLTANEDFIDKHIEQMDKAGIVAVTMASDNYPELLNEIFNPPIVLFAKGRVELLNSRCFAVVGTREPTRYGKDVTENFTTELAAKGFTIVSGPARGVDSTAHRTALNFNKPTIGVLGSGLDKVYPAENKALFLEVAEKGLLLSEYKLGVGVQQYNFPERNRIISGISEGVLVTEAGENSGSLITINHAVEQNKNIYIVPGNIYSKASKGANDRLKMLQGAITTNVNDILRDYNMESAIEEVSEMQLDFVEAQIVGALEKEELHIEQLIQLTGMSIIQLSPLLAKMELLGIIKKLYGNYYGI
ncbi:MAG: DNA-protecting protein DprA [Clostridia bacterium]|nr:DNA-protecting protein DprA [Clostridia bacterium]